MESEHCHSGLRVTPAGKTQAHRAKQAAATALTKNALVDGVMDPAQEPPWHSTS
jgi:hypothetical protein